MKTHILQITIALLCCLHGLAPAQERLTADEVLRWFPAGAYDRITHSDEAALAALGVPESVEARFEGGSRQYMVKLLPRQLERQADSFTCAITRDIKLLGQQELPRPGPYYYTTGYSQWANVGGATYVLRNEGEHIGVYRFADLEAAIEQALRGGLLESTDQALEGKPVYLHRAKSSSGEEWAIHCLPADGSALLAAESLALLAAMAEAGSGGKPNLAGESEYAEFFAQIPELGPRWSYTYTAAYPARMREVLAAEGVEDKQIEQYLRTAAVGSQFQLIEWGAEGGAAYERSWDRLGSAETAKSTFDLRNKSASKDERYELDGCLLKTTRFYRDQ